MRTFITGLVTACLIVVGGACTTGTTEEPSGLNDRNVCAVGTVGYGQPVLIAPEGGLYGDQDSNGLIDGIDCEWS